MNPHSHRLIFNPTRGCLMAVAETSRSSGKSSASGTTRSARTKSARCSRRAEIQASNRPLALVSIARAATNSIAHIALQAARNVQLQAAANTNTISNRNDSNNVGAGVNIGLGQQSGISFQVSANQANGRANGTETTYDNTRITASNTLSVKSGADTTLAGAQLAGDTVKMDVGGKLNIETLQDSSTYQSEQHSSGFSVSVCVPPICYGVPVTGSVSMANQSLDHNYQSATGQSGIAAGNGGFDIKVAGNTDLKGGAVTSTAPPDKNALSTASLTSSDLDNRQNTNSSSSSMNLGYSGASTFATLAQNLVSNGLGNLGGGAGMPEDGSQSGKTSSVISAGNIVITGTGDTAKDANSAQQVATLTSRDATTANQTLSNTLTLQQAQALQAKQKEAQENAQVGQLVGSVAFNVVGDIAQKNGWKDSSPQKIALHAIAGYIQANAAGQNGATGALAAMGNEAFTQAVNAYIDKALPTPTVKDPLHPTAEETAQLRENALSRKALAESAASLLGATAVALVGGSNQAIAFGGAVALNADRNNRQLHPDERQWAKDNAAKYRQYLANTTGEKISTEEAYQRLLSAGYAVTDDAASKTGQSDELAKRFLAETAPKTMFSTTAEERANPLLGGNADGSYTPEQQARFSVTAPANNASAWVTKALNYTGNDCGSNATLCKQKFEAIDNAIGALNQAKLLYQDDPGSVALIDQQIAQLKSGISQNELVSGMAGSVSDSYKNIAGLLSGVPSRLIAGRATAETMELVGLTQAIKDVRIGLPSGAKNSGNVATANVDIAGLPSQMAASSEINVTKNGVIGKGSENFSFLELPNTVGKSVSRNTDSEYKILDNIADKLGNNPNATGTIKIVTERPACDSCLDVAKQFTARYPNIELQIFDNNGVALLPKKTYVTPYFDPKKVGSK
jgi:filamentous hemagglutinin